MARDSTNLIRAISEVAKAVALGDFNKLIDVTAQGEMLDLKLTVNFMVNQLRRLASEIIRVSLDIGTEGILDGQAFVPDVEGMWKILIDNLNLMRRNLTNQVRSIAEVTKAIAAGDLTKKVEVDAKGEILELKDMVNGMTESLSVVAYEVSKVAREVGTEGLLGGQAKVMNVGGTWKDLTDDVNVMANNVGGYLYKVPLFISPDLTQLTLQVRTIAVVTVRLRS